MSLRSRITGDIAGIEGDLGRTRLMLAEGEDLWAITTRLDDIKHRVEAIHQELVTISIYALKEVLDNEGERKTL